MKLADVKKIAAEHGIVVGRMRKAEIIRAIQRAEGNEDCYSIGKAAHCCQEECLWRTDCE
ncbi:MAG: SAP domain-containing protein [Trichlorobacter sp.]|jgi:hypothetical protein